jgi:hypothetical protein
MACVKKTKFSDKNKTFDKKNSLFFTYTIKISFFAKLDRHIYIMGMYM